MSDIPLGALLAYSGPIWYKNITAFGDVSELINEDTYNLGLKNGDLLAQGGWLLADGSRYSPFDSQIGDLNSILQFSWGGQGAPTSYFRIPDLQGVFVRGVSNGGNPRDPDVLERTALYNNGSEGYGVGSYQNDAIQQHEHNETSSSIVDLRYAGHSRGNFVTRPSPGTTTGAINAKLSSETRPKNVQVHWIVKASEKPINLNSLQIEKIS